VRLSLHKSSTPPCTSGQVFHRRYRESVAKTVAKVYSYSSYSLSDIYGILGIADPVLGAQFAAKNVTFVPSIFVLEGMSNGTGKVNMPIRAGSGIKGVYV
jgi:hypothetical protein